MFGGKRPLLEQNDRNSSSENVPKRFCCGISSSPSSQSSIDDSNEMEVTESVDHLSTKSFTKKPSPVINHIVPAVPRRCIRCMAGEPGHTQHIVA